METVWARYQVSTANQILSTEKWYKHSVLKYRATPEMKFAMKQIALYNYRHMVFLRSN